MIHPQLQAVRESPPRPDESEESPPGEQVQPQPAEPKAGDRTAIRETSLISNPKPLLRHNQPKLVFSAAAWLKLQYLCHIGETEIGAFAITRRHDPLYVEDVLTVQQRCSSISVEFDDAAVADFFDEQVDQGRTPDEFFRLWIHTHPCDSAHPSGIDEATFERVFGGCDWAVMFILARGGATYCRARVSTGPRPPERNGPRSPERNGPRPPERNGGRPPRGHAGAPADLRLSMSTELHVAVDYGTITDPDFELPISRWLDEYMANVHSEELRVLRWWEMDEPVLSEQDLLAACESDASLFEPDPDGKEASP